MSTIVSVDGLAGVGVVRCERSVLGRFPKMGSDKNSKEILCKYLLGDTCVCEKHLCVLLFLGLSHIVVLSLVCV